MNKQEIQTAFANLNQKYFTALKKLQEAYEQLDNAPARQIVGVEKVAGLREAAKMIVASEFNTEDLDEDEVYAMLQKASEEELKKKLNFWAMPLPNDNTPEPSKVYITKPKK